MKTPRFCRSGFTLVEIMIVVAIIGLLATIAIPNFMRARTKSQQNACIGNLRQIDGAVQQWALENKMSATAPVTVTDIEPYLGRSSGSINGILCPSAGSSTTNFSASYSITSVDAPPTCLIGANYAAAHAVQ